jgi:hypothetical protein
MLLAVPRNNFKPPNPIEPVKNVICSYRIVSYQKKEVLMSELERSLDQLHRSFYGEAWHGEGMLEVLKGVTAQQAIQRPVQNGHTIWELVKHSAFWLDVVRERILGIAIEPTEPRDWQPMADTDEPAWQRALGDLQRAQDQLEAVLKNLSPEAFTAKLPGREFGADFLVYGVIQHTGYHGGQIGLIKKALS